MTDDPTETASHTGSGEPAATVGDDGEAATAATDGRESPPTNRRVVAAVGLYAAVGLGFILTFFFVNQFIGGGTTDAVAGQLFGGAGAVVGFALAVVLSPLVAVLVGRDIAADDGVRSAVDAALASVVGFLVMVFAGLAVASALGGAASDTGTSVIGAGPLVGFTVGIGLTAAGAAAVTRADTVAVPVADGNALRGAAVTGVATFLVFGVGYTISIFLASALGPGGRPPSAQSLGFGGGLFNGVAVALVFALLLSPIVAILVGRIVGDRADDPSEGAAAGGLAAAVGIVGLLLVVFVALMVFSPVSGTETGGFEGALPLGSLLGFVVGVGLTGAGSGYVTAR
ncbi:hypothetical protein [Halosegnis longus]|uniref:Uncharacterized protein n=1 Tax=Halosegnis longus TaxID=2216012 RepID=A0AAJ4R838_9EURY|nr:MULTISPECIES: hypothetical protein [Halobacteriales]RNJ25930.1 hypothetical protein Nmn1133_04015 [Salella cibi]